MLRYLALVVLSVALGSLFIGRPDGPTANAQAAPYVLDHFECYAVPPAISFNETLGLQDQFDVPANVIEQVQLRVRTEFCAPTQKLTADGIVTPITHRDDHLTFYEFDEATPGPFPPTITVRNQFGEQVLTLGAPTKLAVPTHKILPGPHNPPVDLDHFKCYRVARSAPLNATVVLSDQFPPDVNAFVMEPHTFCNPTSKSHGAAFFGINHPEAHLVCYSLEASQGITATAQVRNQIETADLTLTGPTSLCVPSEKEEPGDHAPLDHFWCYRSEGAPLIDESVVLRDQFTGTGEVSPLAVTTPHHFCNPVSKIHDDRDTPIENPDHHLLWYNLFPTGLAITPINVVVDNQFGEQRLRVFESNEIAVPTRKLPHAQPVDLDHYRCYRVEGAPVSEVVALEDQFIAASAVAVLEPVRLCNPVEKLHNGQRTPILHPDDHLVCYTARFPSPTRNLIVTNQFPGTTFQFIFDPEWLCVPSSKEIVPPEPELGHFKCYTIVREEPKFTPVTVTLRDQFQRETSVVQKPVEICNPVEKQHAGQVFPILRPQEHLKVYALKDTKAADDKNRTVEVADQFGRHIYTLQDIEHLMVPASKSHLPNPPGLPPTLPGHFKCYKVVGEVDPKFSPVSGVTLIDQFHTEQVIVAKPERLCNPAEKVHSGVIHPIVDPDAHLMCYNIKDIPPVRRFPKQTVAVGDQFLRQIVDVQKPALLCVPASKRELN